MENKQIKRYRAGNFTTDLSKRILEDHEIISGEEGRKYANRLDNRSLNYSMVAHDIIERFGLGKESKILEVCAGAGQLSHYVSEHLNPFGMYSGRIIATDGSPELIVAAKEKYCFDPVQFEVANVHNHPYSGENDVVICKDSFHHFENPKKALEELLGLARPSGAVYIYDLARDAPDSQIEQRIMQLPNVHERERALRSLNASFTQGELENLFEGSSAESFDITYPLTFSQDNLDHHMDQIRIDPVREQEFDRLSRISVLYKGKGGTK